MRSVHDHCTKEENSIKAIHHIQIHVRKTCKPALSRRQENGKNKKSQWLRVIAGKGGGGGGLTTLGRGEVICERRNERGECSGAEAKK